MHPCSTEPGGYSRLQCSSVGIHAKQSTVVLISKHTLLSPHAQVIVKSILQNHMLVNHYNVDYTKYGGTQVFVIIILLDKILYHMSTCMYISHYTAATVCLCM